MLGNFHVSEVLLLLQDIQELPDGRVRASHHGVEAVMPHFSQVRGSGKVEEDVVLVVPLGVIKQGTATGGSNPSTFEVLHERVHARRYQGLHEKRVHR